MWVRRTDATGFFLVAGISVKPIGENSLAFLCWKIRTILHVLHRKSLEAIAICKCNTHLRHVAYTKPSAAVDFQSFSMGMQLRASNQSSFIYFHFFRLEFVWRARHHRNKISRSTGVVESFSYLLIECSLLEFVVGDWRFTVYRRCCVSHESNA